MDRKKLDKLRKQVEKMRGSPQKASALESLARRLGRKKVKRGKEPNWESELLNIYPVSIPHHGKNDIPPGTANRILDQFETEIDAWEVKLSNNGHGGTRSEDENE